MRLDELKPNSARTKNSRRVGRGIGSGSGKTSGRGHKGQLARSGGHSRPGFEGGQMPLVRRVPKRGFTNIFKKKLAIFNVGELERFEAGTVVTPELLVETGLVKKIGDGVKLLGEGEVTRPVTVRVHAVSKQAAAKVEAAGGKVEVI